MIIGFTGTKRGMTQRQRATVRYLLAELQMTELHHGDCVGADAQAHQEALLRGAAVVVHPPADPKLRAYCSGFRVTVLEPREYLKRNGDIVDACEVLICAPKQKAEQVRSGTWTTIRYAKKRGRVDEKFRIITVWPDGMFEEVK